MMRVFKGFEDGWTPDARRQTSANDWTTGDRLQTSATNDGLKTDDPH